MRIQIGFLNNKKNPENKRLKCDSFGFVSCLRDAGLQKNQGTEVLDALGLIVLSLNKQPG